MCAAWLLSPESAVCHVGTEDFGSKKLVASIFFCPVWGPRRR